MAPLNNAYAAALQAPLPAGPPAMPIPASEPAPAVMPRTPKDVNPMTQQGETFFLDPAMFEGMDCNVGDEVMLKATIQSKGSKIGLVPAEIVMEGEMPGEDVGDEGTDSDESAAGYDSPNIP